MKINIGCGDEKLDGFINIDYPECDLNDLPIPFLSESADYILCKQVLEHVENLPVNILKEFLRVIKPNGVIKIIVPHFSWHNAYDETHVRFFNASSFGNTYLGNPQRNLYKTFNRKVHIGFMTVFPFWYNRLIEKLVNINSKTQLLYESTFLVYLFPANNLQFTITKN